MARPPFLNRCGATGAHPRATPEQRKPAKGSRFNFASCRPFLGAAWMTLNLGLAVNAVQCFAQNEIGPGLVVGIGASVSSYLFAAWAIGTVCKGVERAAEGRGASQSIREHHERRERLKAQIAAMHKHDPRRGEAERQLRESTLVVLSGGRP